MERKSKRQCAFSLHTGVAIDMQQAEVDGSCDKLIKFALSVYLPASARRYTILMDFKSVLLIKGVM